MSSQPANSSVEGDGSDIVEGLDPGSFDIDGWDYGSMEDKAENAALINRARLEDG